MNFQELTKNRFDRNEITVDLSKYECFILGMIESKNAIIDLLLKINDENYNIHGEHINQSCREEAETIERIINLIKYGNDYE